ncbi:MAG TPA: type VI secretion system tip protein TssI/VgrG, partial [Polyangiaceae bacterium]|nr:type VI secretion system tip protein TssI/VgrG [Polyangiaceae bacterium]
GAVSLTSIRGDEELSTLFTYVGEARVPLAPLRGGSGQLRPEKVVGDVASITFRDFWGSERTITGLVSDAEVQPFDVGEAKVRFTLRPLMFKSTLGRNSRTFHDKDVVEIAKEVFQREGIDARFEVTGTYGKRVYTAQYRESDFDFVCRLLEEEGIYYWFDHADGSKLVIADHSSSAPSLDDAAWKAGAPTGALLMYRPELGLESDKAFIRELGVRPRALATKFAVGSFDPSKPTFKLSAETGDDGIEHYDAPGANVDDPKVLEHRAVTRAERARAVASITKGSSPSVRIAPGRAFEIFGHPFGRMDGRYVVVSTSLQIDNVGGLGEGQPIDISFSSVPKDVAFRPAPVTAVPKHPGIHSGQVIGPAGEEVYPDDSGRVRIQQHWDREGQKDEKSGRWVRVAQRGTSGSMLLPRTGWNVLSMGEEGSVDLPMVLSRTFDGEHPPPYALPENKTRVAYRTATTPGGGTFNEIRYEDKKGSEEVFINATKDMDVLVNNVKGEAIHGYHLHEVGANHTLTVGGNYDVHVDKDQTVDVAGNQSEKVAAERQKLVNGSETIKIGGSRSLKTGENAENAAPSRSLKVGAANITAVLGEVKAQTKMMNQLVGGAVIKATPRAMTEVVGSEVNADTVVGFLPAAAQKAFGKLKALPGASKLLDKVKAKAGISVQTIGGMKFEKAGEDRKIAVEKTYKETLVAGL